MRRKISERSFEEAIECALLQYGPDACAGEPTGVLETPPTFGDTPPGGYRRRRSEDYDRALCLLPSDVVDFVLGTQPKEWQKLAQHHGASVKEQFLKRLATEIERRGALDVLRQGVKDSGASSGSPIFARRAVSMKRPGASMRRTSSPRCGSSVTATGTRSLSTSPCS